MLNKLPSRYTETLFGWPTAPVPEFQRLEAKVALARFDLDTVVDEAKVVELPLPADMGTAADLLDQATKVMGAGRLELLDKWAARPVYPSLPDVPDRPGWQKLVKGRWQAQTCYPDLRGQAACLDFETVLCADGHWRPVCAALLTAGGQVWTWLADFDQPLLDTIEFGQGATLVGHNCPYDRKYLACEYNPRHTAEYKEVGANRWVDTMALWIATRGYSNQQRTVYAKARKSDYKPGWYHETGPNSLDAVYRFYTGKYLDKGCREAAIKGGYEWVKANAGQLMAYCVKDVLATVKVFSYVWPEARAAQHPASLVAQMLIGSYTLPLSRDRQPGFYDRAEAIYQAGLADTAKTLEGLAEATVARYLPELLELVDRAKVQAKAAGAKVVDLLPDMARQWADGLGPQLASLDWTPASTGATKGLPKWHRDTKGDYSLGKRWVPAVLGLTWLGQPVYYGPWSASDDMDGWDRSDDDGSDGESDAKSGYVTPVGSVPHPKYGTAKPAGDLFAKGFVKAFETGALAGSDVAKGLLERLVGSLVWRSTRKRVKAMYVQPVGSLYQGGCPTMTGDVTVTGTISRRCTGPLTQVMPNTNKGRIGTEVKSLIEAPEGYLLVGADVASQEAWLAGLLGDSMAGFCGATPLGLMTTAESPKTKLHDVVAATMGMARSDVKTLNYGVIYGLGLKGATDLLVLTWPGKPRSECQAKAAEYMDTFKGRRENGRYSGGLGSLAFNAMTQIANAKVPKTPLLGCHMTKALAGVKDFATSRGNWPIQSSGVDFRDLLVLFSEYLFCQYELDARVILTIHDEIRCLAKAEQAPAVAYCLQMAHLYIRGMFIDALALDCIPAGVAWFPGIDVDTVLRKESDDPCVTPSQPEPIPPGQLWSPNDILDLVDSGQVACYIDVSQPTKVLA